MSQKINALGFRLKKRLNWNFQFSVDKKNYSKLLFANNENYYFLKVLFKKFGFFFNNNYFTTDSKKNQIFLGINELLNTQDLINKTFIYNKLYSKLESLTLNVFSQKKQKYTKSPNYGFFSTVSCSLICEYIADQLRKPIRLRNKSFVKNIGNEGSGQHGLKSNIYDVNLIKYYKKINKIKTVESSYFKAKIANYFFSQSTYSKYLKFYKFYKWLSYKFR